MIVVDRNGMLVASTGLHLFCERQIGYVWESESYSESFFDRKL